MSAMLRYLAGYWLDFLRERVTAEDFGGADVRRVLVTPGLSPESLAAVRRMFPRARLYAADPRWTLAAVRGFGFDAACVSMTGGELRPRALALFSRARHRLLIPSPDYIYRLGLRRGWAALVWAVVDRLLLAPVALVWFGLVCAWLYARGLPAHALGAERQPARCRETGG